MFKYPDPFPTTTSAARTLMCKTFQVKYTDVYMQLATNQSNGGLLGGNGGFGFQPQNAYGTARGLKAVFPGQATFAGMALYNNANANTAGTTPAAFLAIGRSIGFTTIVGNGTTSTVTTPNAHGLTASDVIHVSDTTLATGVATTSLNTVTSVTVNGVSTNTIDGNQPKVVTPSATTPNQFTFLSSFNGTAVAGLIVCLSYYAYPSVLASGTPISTGFQWLGIKNVGTFAAVTPASYWTVAPSAVLGNVTTPGTPAVWSVTGNLSTALGSDGNYNYFVEPTQDLYLYGFFQEYATSGLVAATSGGPWTVWVHYFM